MSFIQRELDSVSAALRDSANADRYEQLYAAQQALAWALEPQGFRALCTMILPTGTPEGSGDYSAPLHQPLS